MGGGGKYRGSRRRAVVAGGGTGLVAATAGCLSSAGRALGLGGYDAVVVDVDGEGVVWSGEVQFSTADGTRVTIPVERALGNRSYTLPDDIDADGYDAIYPPISISVVPNSSVDDADPLTVAVRCDGETCGRASTAEVGEPARVEVD